MTDSPGASRAGGVDGHGLRRAHVDADHRKPVVELPEGRGQRRDEGLLSLYRPRSLLYGESL